MPTAQEVADFLGRGDDEATVAAAGETLPIITAMASAYTRGKGFSDGQPNAEIDAVITVATARLMANPDQLDYSVGGVRMAGFRGWSLAELFVLNRYRRRAQ